MGSKNIDRFDLRLWRVRAETVAQMIDQDYSVVSRCKRCHRTRPVQMGLILRTWGSSFSIWDLDLLECPTRACRGDVELIITPQPGVPAFPAWAARDAGPPLPPPNHALWYARRRERALKREADMDEIETRMAALELIMLELIPWVDRGAVEDASASIRAKMDSCSGDELAVRRSALALLNDGLGRFQQAQLPGRKVG